MDSTAPLPIGMTDCVALRARRERLSGRHTALLVALAEAQAAYGELDARIHDLATCVTESYRGARRSASLDEQDPWLRDQTWLLDTDAAGTGLRGSSR